MAEINVSIFIYYNTILKESYLKKAVGCLSSADKPAKLMFIQPINWVCHCYTDDYLTPTKFPVYIVNYPWQML